MSGRRGMTLLELLVALVIVMIMMGFIGTIYVRAMRIRSRTQETTALAATARGALGLIRRDLTGAFGLAVRTYDFSHANFEAFYGTKFEHGTELHWEAPVIPGNPANGFRRLTFVSAVDGSRIRTSPPYALYHHEYDLVSWAVRGGAFFRAVGNFGLTVTVDDSPSGWEIVSYTPPSVPALPEPQGIQIDREVYGGGGGATFDSIGAYRGTPFIRTVDADAQLPRPITFKDSDGNLAPMTVTVAFDRNRSDLPDWVRDFRPLTEEITASNLVTYRLFSRDCPDGKVTLGRNGGGTMYFVILEPLVWSPGEDARDLVFYPPTGYGDVDGTLGWADDENGSTLDRVWTGPVPRYVDVYLTMSDPKHASGMRRFGQRMGIPAGGGP